MAMVTVPVLHTDRVDVALDLLSAAAESLTGAHVASTVHGRAAGTRLGVLRAAAAVLAVRGRSPAASGSAGVRGHSAGPQDVWQLLPQVAPELTEWADFFAAVLSEGDDRQWRPSVREADDLLRQGEEFVSVVAGQLGLPPVTITGALTSLGPATGGLGR